MLTKRQTVLQMLSANLSGMTYDQMLAFGRDESDAALAVDAALPATMVAAVMFVRSGHCEYVERPFRYVELAKYWTILQQAQGAEAAWINSDGSTIEVYDLGRCRRERGYNTAER